MWPHDPIAVVYEWEVLRDSDVIGPCGTNQLQSTAMQRLADALRAAGRPAWGRISRRIFTYGLQPDDSSIRVLVRVELDDAGFLRWTSATS